MKKTSKSGRRSASGDDLKPEYTFDYSKSKPNRFAARVRDESVAVVLDPDVASVFKDAGSVNAVLRAVMQAMPLRSKRKSH